MHLTFLDEFDYLPFFNLNYYANRFHHLTLFLKL